MESQFLKTVNLTDWWLTKADNNSSSNTVAVSGVESAGRLAARVFLSAPIVERLDLFTLKTKDGVFVILRSLINKQQTCANGFSEEVFKHFLVGFPPNWEECAEKCVHQVIDPYSTEDANIDPDQSTVPKPGNATVKLRQMLRKDSDSSTRPDHTTEARKAVSELNCQTRNPCAKVDIYDSNAVPIEEGVRYRLRNREVHYSEREAIHKGKEVFKDMNLISDLSPGGKSRHLKKRKRNEGATTQTNTLMTKSLLKNNAEVTDAFTASHVVCGNNIENLTGRGEGENKCKPVHLRSKSVKVKKQRSGLTRTTLNSEKFHDSARATLKKCTPKGESKAAVAEQERKTSQGSTPKLKSKRKLVFDKGTPCTPMEENKTPTSQSSVLRTSRSGRLLMPTMEFWRNQLPIYDPDRGLSGIREGSTILKVKPQKGGEIARQ